MREIGEKTWRGKRKVNAVGEDNIPTIETAGEEQVRDWGELDSGEFQQAILNLGANDTSTAVCNEEDRS